MNEIKLPISPRDNWKRVVRRDHPKWMPSYFDTCIFIPRVVPDNIARAMIYEVQPQTSDAEKGGLDMFGVEWEYVPTVGGSMEKPGIPHVFEDVNEWKEKLTFPDVDSWDWEGCYQRNKDFIDKNKFAQTWMFTGFFERLISFMGFEESALALIDEDQQDAILELFDKLADLYNEILTRLKKYFDVDFVFFHDDWGSQASSFFSLNTCRQMLVPALKKVVDHCHEIGMIFELHCCGRSEGLVPAMIEAGVDIWSPQPMNDRFALRRQYGDKIVFGYECSFKTTEEGKALVDQIVEEIKDDAIEKPFYFWDPTFNAEVHDYLMEKTLALYDKK